jgi:hypothetical protein
LLEFIEGNSKLAKNFEEQRGSYLLAAVNWNRDGPAIRMIPPLVTSCLAGKFEAQF